MNNANYQNSHLFVNVLNHHDRLMILLSKNWSQNVNVLNHHVLLMILLNKNWSQKTKCCESARNTSGAKAPAPGAYAESARLQGHA